jgi:hypothetical protein
MSVSMNGLFYDLQNAAYSIKDSAPVQTPKKCGQVAPCLQNELDRFCKSSEAGDLVRKLSQLTSLG